uniref:Zgc:112496 n=1 Tax=Sinocyclocheilus grahami TaxID=75366 RepID=A0A672K1J0_SINGR
MMDTLQQKGKFRPRLQQLIGSNSEEAVQSSTSKAFGLLPDVQAAITELCKLKGVGPATASAVLAAGAPGEVAFMADEAVESIAELRPVEYTAKHYALFLQKILNKSSQLNKGKRFKMHVQLKCSSWGSDCDVCGLSGRPAGLDSSQGGAVFMGLGRGQSDSAIIITGVQSDGCNTHFSGQSEAREEEDS